MTIYWYFTVNYYNNQTVIIFSFQTWINLLLDWEVYLSWDKYLQKGRCRDDIKLRLLRGAWNFQAINKKKYFYIHVAKQKKAELGFNQPLI